MNIDLNRAFLPREEDVKRPWLLIDAAGKTVGRLATEIARTLQGKNREIYTAHVKTGSYVVVVNAEKVVFSGKKMDIKTYRKYTGYRGNDQEFTAKEVMKSRPEFIIESAVKRMLPKTKMGKQLFETCFRVYAGPTHPHRAQIAPLSAI